MCRWIGYRGDPIAPRVLLYEPERSLIAQSVKHAPELLEPNGDGTGLGWYDRRKTPAVFRSDSPAWGDENLRELADEVCSPLFLAHVRAGTGTPVQKTNCHPFRYREWLFVHNGYVAGFESIRRELLMAVRPDLFSNIKGSTDSEVIFHLALTFGLEKDPLGGLERMAGFVESVGAAAGIAEPLQMTVGLTDGETLFAARYASGPVVNTLYMSEDVDAIRMLYPEHERLRRVPDHARAVLSEPLSELPGVWHEIPPSTALVVTDMPHDITFHPQPPG
ncbi:MULTISPECIES: class II glutamine amidotransferase [Pseudofrankia]|uniref:class II glutamine amidotransferase n=1 Tax=Pseudofrankia TaxID=2994363 RepID=UPI000234B157|nr:class II glutamine amidotransferase [Pseudofrankia sp. EUN1h]